LKLLDEADTPDIGRHLVRLDSEQLQLLAPLTAAGVPG
jgi:hypothetical protein